MMLLTILDTLYQNLLDSTWLEGIAVFFGLLSVWYAKKENILVFPTGIISVLIYVYICLFAKLYADMGINFFYFVMSVYGWYNWSRRDSSNKQPISISFLDKKGWLFTVVSVILFFIILAYFLTQFTDSNVPLWDSATTSIFLVGMWLMAKKKIENWLLWIVGDLISIPLYAYKGLVLSSFQFTVFLILAIAGYIEWRQRIKTQKEVVA